MNKRSVTIALTSALSISGLVACGGGGGGGGVGSTVVGTIAGFGSIIMSNGNEYSTNNISSCRVDDDQAPGVCEDSLSPGMHVRLHVDANGTVESVEYDDDLEGPATNVSGSAGNYSFMIFGAEVMTSDSGTQWSDFSTSPPSLAELDGANVEVSGEWQNGILHATYVEMQNDMTHEAEGLVNTVNGTDFILILKDGTSIDVDAANANLLPQPGDYVEIEGNYDGTTFFAIEIEFEDQDDFDSDGEAEITGTLVQDAGSSTGYSIGSTAVDISNAPTCNGLEGTVVEAEGYYDQTSGVLIARECEDEEDELEMKCQVSDVTVYDPNAPKVGLLECDFPNTAGGPLPIEFRDAPELASFSDDSWSNPFDLNSVNTDDCVEIKASDASGALVAGALKLESIGGGCSEYELEGPVEVFTDLDIITVLGITYRVDGATNYDDGLPVQGDYVEITDNDADGIADSVEIDS
jgi:hypothetical protein